MYFHNCSFGSFPFLFPFSHTAEAACTCYQSNDQLNAVLLGLVPLSREVFSWHEGERDSGWEWCKAQQRKVRDLLCNCLSEILINVCYYSLTVHTVLHSVVLNHLVGLCAVLSLYILYMASMLLDPHRQFAPLNTPSENPLSSPVGSLFILSDLHFVLPLCFWVKGSQFICFQRLSQLRLW